MPRILLIEDDANVCMVMEHTLFDGGYEVDTSPFLPDTADRLAEASLALLGELWQAG